MISTFFTGKIGVYLICTLVLALFWGGVVYGIYSAGANAEREKWQGKYNAELVESQAKVLRLTTQYRDLEREANQQLTKYQLSYEEQLRNEKERTNRIVADVNAGAKRLSVATSTSALRACKSGGANLSPNSTAVNSEARAELSQSAAANILAIGHEADEAIIESNYAKDLLAQCHAHVQAINQISANHE